MNTGKTSLNQVPAGMKQVSNWPGLYNFDYGGGKYDTATKWLLENHGVHNIVYDKYNQNNFDRALALARLPVCSSLTCFNTLNVMKAKERQRFYQFIDHRINLKTVFISVYEGDRSGVGKKTTKGWQNNQPLSFYLEEISKVKFYFDWNCRRKGKSIILEKG